LASEAKGRGFDPRQPHHLFPRLFPHCRPHRIASHLIDRRYFLIIIVSDFPVATSQRHADMTQLFANSGVNDFFLTTSSLFAASGDIRTTIHENSRQKAQN
jgi:hypothetical protein